LEVQTVKIAVGGTFGEDAKGEGTWKVAGAKNTCT